MTIIRPNTMPRFWWLVPWAYARTLHMSANALKAYADKADSCVEMQIRIIEDKDRQIERLKQQNTALCLERIAQKPTDDFTAFMVKLKNEHMNINEFNSHPNNTHLPR